MQPYRLSVLTAARVTGEDPFDECIIFLCHRCMPSLASCHRIVSATGRCGLLLPPASLSLPAVPFSSQTNPVSSLMSCNERDNMFFPVSVCVCAE